MVVAGVVGIAVASAAGVAVASVAGVVVVAVAVAVASGVVFASYCFFFMNFEVFQQLQRKYETIQKMLSIVSIRLPHVGVGERIKHIRMKSIRFQYLGHFRFSLLVLPGDFRPLSIV